MTDHGRPLPGLPPAPSGTPPPPPPPPSRPPVLPDGRSASPPRAAYDLESGVVDIRPLRFTDILDGAFQLCRSGLRVIVPLVLLLMVPLQLLAAYLQRDALTFGLTGLLDDPEAAAVLLGEGGGSPALLLNAGTQVLLVPLLAGALVWIAGRRHDGRDATLRQVVATTGAKAGWLIVAYVATILLRGLAVVLVVPAVVSGSPVAIALTVMLAGATALLLTPLFAVVVPAIMLQPRPPVDAFLNALRLARSDYWRVTGVVVGTTVVFNLLAVLLASLPNVIGLIGGFGFAWVLVAAGNVITQLVAAPLTAAAMVLLHADLRVRQEGLDFDVLLARMRPVGDG